MPQQRINQPRSRLFKRWVWAAFLLLGNGCTFLKPAPNTGHYYILTSTVPAATMERSGTEHPEGYRLRIAPIELADYLKRKEMVVRTGTNEILYAVFHRWAEPLDAGIRRVLADDLRAATGIDDLLPDKASQESSPAYTASIRILACEGVHLASQDSVEFVAQWQLTGPGAFTARGTFRMKPTAWREMDYDDLAHHLSEAVDELSRVLLHAIALHDSVPSGMIKTLNRGAYYWREVLYCRFNAPGRQGDDGKTVGIALV